MKTKELIFKSKEWLLKHKKLMYIFAFIFLMIVLFLSKKNNNKQDPETNQESTKTNEVNIESQKIDFEKEIFNSETEAYYFNAIVTNKIPVTGFSWLKDKIAYSTPQGIYEGGTNNIIFEGTINESKWSNNFNALIKYQGSWNKLNYKNKSLEKIDMNLTSPSISNDGNYILDYSNNTLSVFNITDLKNKYKEVKLREPITKAFFSDDSKRIIVSTNFGKITYLYRFDLELNGEFFYETDNDYILTGIDSIGDNCLLSLKNELYVSDFKELKLVSTFKDNAEIYADFIRKDILIVEKYKDNLGRELDDVYLSKNNNTYKIADSKQIVNRLNTSINFIFNESKTVVSFIENKNKIWILSLNKNLFPTYTINGDLVFSDLIPRGHQ